MEIFKILKNRKFIAAVIFLLLLNCVSFYITQQKNIADFGVNIHTYSDTFKENSDVFLSSDQNDFLIENNNKFKILSSFAEAEKLKIENAEEYEYFAVEEAFLIQENPELYKEYKEGNYSYEKIAAFSDFYDHFAYQLEYQNGYQVYIDLIIENAQNLSSKKLFSDKDSFSYKSIQKSSDDFFTNKDIELSLVNDLPVSSVLSYQIGDFILILLCIFMAIVFVSEKNVDQLLNTCKNGRIKLKLKQLVVLILFSVLSSFLIYISELFISLTIYNAPLNLYAAIQSSNMFSDCILHMNFLQFFAIHIIFKAIVAIMIAFVIWFLISISNNIIVVSGIAGIIAVTELLLYKNISAQSNLSFFKTFNIFSLFDYSSITEYNLVSLFTIPYRADYIIWIIILFITFLAGCSVILSAKRNYPIKSPKKFFCFFYILIQKLSVFYNKLQEFFYAGRYETFKIMHIGKGLLVVIAFVLIVGFNFNTNPLVFSSTEVFLNAYYEEYGGELDEKIYESMDQMQQVLEDVDVEFTEKSLQYSNGKITFEEYEVANAKNAAYDTQRKALDELKQQVSRIAPLADKGIKPVIINEIGYNNLFFNQSNQNEILILICAVTILLSSVFSVEKASDMITLNHCSRYGRKQLYFKKIFTVVPKIFVLTAISYTVFLLQNHYLYKLDHLSADIHNLQCLQDVNLNVSILEYIILNFVFEFVFVTIIGLIITALSAFVSQLMTIIISCCAFLLPSALYMISVYSAKEMSVIYQLNFNALILEKGVSINSFSMHFILVIICVILLFLCKRNWCLTKER